MASSNQRLNATVTIGGALSQSFRGAISSSRRQIASVGDAIKQLKTREQRLSRVADHWEKQGREARQYREEIERINDQVGKLRRNQEKLGSIRQAQSANFANRERMRGQLFDAVAIGATAAAPITAAVRFESTLADLNKVANLTPKRLAEVRKEILGMSREMPVAVDQIGAIMTAAAQSGVAENQMAGFTRSAIKMGVAFDIAGGQAGEMMAKWRTGMKLTQPQVNALADVTNYLSNKMAATAPEIADVITRVGAYAKTAGIGEKQTAALAASMIAAGGAPEKVATGIRRMASNLTAGASATKSQIGALQQLGLTATGMARRMQEDAGGAIQDLLLRVQALDKTVQPSVIKDLFGQESVDVIAPLLTNLEGLQQAQRDVADSTRYLGSMQAEYESRSKTTENNLQLLTNKTVALGVTLGSVLLPPLNIVADVLGTGADAVASLAEQFPLATKVIVGTTVALAGLKVASIVGGYGFTFLKGGAMSVVGWLYRTEAAALAASTSTTSAAAGPTRLGQALLGVGFASKTAVRALFTMRGALIATGIGALVVGIGTAAAWLVRNWEPVKAFFIGVWSGIRTAMDPVVARFGELLDRLGPVGDAVRFVGRMIGNAVGWFLGLFDPVDATEAKLKSFQRVGESVGAAIGWVFKTLAEGVASRLEWIADKVEWVGGVFGKAKRWLGFGDDEKSAPDIGESRKPMRVGDAEPRRPIYQAGQNQDGDVSAPLRRGSSGAQLTDNSQTTNNVTVVQQPGEDGQALAERAADAVERRQRERGRSALYDQGPAYGY